MSDHPAAAPVPPPTGEQAPGGRRDPQRPALHREFLERALVTGQERSWRALEIVARTGSTNADLAVRARAGEGEGLVLVADHQSAGRGRLTRSWQTPPRSSLAVSVLLRPRVDQRYWSWLPLLAGLAVAETLRGTCGLWAGVKWPNDVLVRARGRTGGTDRGDGQDPVHPAEPVRPLEPVKVCGILAEMVLPASPGPAGPAVVLGAGLNVSQRPEELPVATAGSLVTAGAQVTDRDVVLRDCLRALAVRYTAWQDRGGDPRASGLEEDLVRSCVTLGRRVVVHLEGGVPLSGTADGIDGQGRLLVTDDAGRRHVLAAGDVVHVRGRRAPGGVPGLV